MIVITAALVFALLIFAPISLRTEIVLFPHKLSATAKVSVGAIGVFDEKVRLAGDSLVCDGTVSTDVEIKSIDKQSGLDLLRCVTVEKFCLSFFNNVACFSPVYAAIQNVGLALATTTACNLFHCKIYSECVGTLGESCIRLRALVNLSVAELSFCLLKQGVRKWIRKSEK